MRIFEITKTFPDEERYALISQIRRSSRSVCETDSSLDFARDCDYISAKEHRALTSACFEIGRMLGQMMKKSDSFLLSE
jgi:23S rRNA-intervening sequence protein